MSTILNVCVIGTGTAGLCAAKYALQNGFNVTVYEQQEVLGGTWWYSDQTGKDKYGVGIHTAMYQGLRTNLPYQVMSFPDHPYPEETKQYPPQRDVLKYLDSYAERFGLKSHIKYSTLVIRVLPIEDQKWEVIVKDLPTNVFETKIYDAVFVCNGHHFTPRIPKIDGVEEFKGQILHSHDFRSAETFKDETVLVIGGGPSGMDLVSHLSKTATRVTFSQHKRPHETAESLERRKSLLPPKVTLQENVKRFTRTGAEFIDGSHETFTVIFYATGYNFSYPFLSVDCGIKVDDNYIESLYKQIINIEYPTMAFIGIPFTVCTTQMYDLQTRFAMKFISGAKKLPTKSEMLTDMRAQTAIHWNKGYRKHHTHYMGPEQREYFKQLSTAADVQNLPDVLAAMHFDSRATMAREPAHFRKYRYTIVDDKTFTKEKVED